MSQKYDILVVGEINADLILTGDVEPAFGQVEKIINDATLTLGSSAVIFACGAARLGLKVAFVGIVGDDLYGHYMLEGMRLREVETRYVIIDPDQRTGLSVILSRKDERAILTYSGAINALRTDQVDRELMRQCRHMHVASYYLQSSLRPDMPYLLAEAKQLGMTVSLDTNWDPLERWDGGIHHALSLTDIFLPNEQEAIAISRVSDVKVASEKLASQVSIVAIKRGDKGAIAQRGSERVICQAFPVEVIDATGAGDSFNAGFIFGFIKGFGLLDSLRMGCACGALSTRSLGGVESQPTLDQVMDFLEDHH